MRRRRHLSALVAATLAVLSFSAVSPYAEAAGEDEASLSSEHFTITWPTDSSDPARPDVADKDDSGYPDSIEKLLRVFEKARAFQLDVLELAPPPNDDDYPLYVNPGAATIPISSSVQTPSYILVRPDLVQGAASTLDMRTFASHEYAHAIQYGYDVEEDDWLMEASATWVEGAFNPHALPNLGKLIYFLANPRESLGSGSEAREYGAFLFLQFLSERFDAGGQSFLEQLWSSAAREGVSSYEAIEEWVIARGSTLHEMWREFSLWNWRLGKYEHGSRYRRAVAGYWPLTSRSYAVQAESCRRTTDGGSPFAMPALSSEYVRFAYPSERVRQGVVRIQGRPGATGTAIITDQNGPEEVPLNFSADGLITFSGAFGSTAISKVVLSLGNPSLTESPATFVYSSMLDGTHQTVATPPSGAASTIFGQGVSLSGVVACGGLPAPSANVVLVQTYADGTEVRFPLVTDHAFSGSAGSWRVVAAPEENATYRLIVDDPWISNATSSEVAVVVEVFVSMEVQSNNVSLGSPVRIEGSLSPVHVSARMRVEFRRPAGVWREGRSMLADQEGRYAADQVLPAKGVWELRTRVVELLDSDHGPGLSLSHTVFVEDLPQGGQSNTAS